jgi:hypothetical protein
VGGEAGGKKVANVFCGRWAPLPDSLVSQNPHLKNKKRHAGEHDETENKTNRLPYCVTCSSALRARALRLARLHPCARAADPPFV